MVTISSNSIKFLKYLDQHVSLMLLSKHLLWCTVLCIKETDGGEWGGDMLEDGHVTRRNEPISGKRGHDILDIILRMPDVMDSGRR